MSFNNVYLFFLPNYHILPLKHPGPAPPFRIEILSIKAEDWLQIYALFFNWSELRTELGNQNVGDSEARVFRLWNNDYRDNS